MRTSTLTVLALAAVILAGNAAAAELKIAVVDPMEAISNSTQFKKERESLEKDMAGDKSKLIKLQSDLNVCKQKMAADVAAMSQTEQVKLKTDCENKLRDYQILGQAFNKAAGEREQAMLRDIAPKLQRAVDAVAKEGGYDLVIQREALAFVKPAFEITDKVTIKLNALP